MQRLRMYVMSAGIALIAIILLTIGLLNLRLERHGLVLVGDVRGALRETPSAASAAVASFDIVTLELDHSSSWEEIRRERSLSFALIEESFACNSGGRRTKYDEIKDRVLEVKSKIRIVLRSGACPKP